MQRVASARTAGQLGCVMNIGMSRQVRWPFQPRRVPTRRQPSDAETTDQSVAGLAAARRGTASGSSSSVQGVSRVVLGAVSS